MNGRELERQTLERTRSADAALAAAQEAQAAQAKLRSTGQHAVNTLWEYIKDILVGAAIACALAALLVQVYLLFKILTPLKTLSQIGEALADRGWADRGADDAP